jgi:hypothetical protein
MPKLDRDHVMAPAVMAAVNSDGLCRFANEGFCALPFRLAARGARNCQPGKLSKKKAAHWPPRRLSLMTA